MKCNAGLKWNTGIGVCLEGVEEYGDVVLELVVKSAKNEVVFGYLGLVGVFCEGGVVGGEAVVEGV
jgi:hypothetical protein